jgi:pimeloyl-ACP methyl ester carboxylesterase
MELAMNHAILGGRPSDEGCFKVDIGGRALSATRMGIGTPTVIFETGLGAESAEWTEIQRAIGVRTTACRYDRAGRGGSESAGSPRTALDMVTDLEKMLYAADFVPPYILVGHSFGGLLARLFAHRHRESVVGLVLVESLHEDQFAAFADAFPEPRASDSPALRGARAFWTGGWRSFESTAERIDFATSIDQGHSVVSLGDMPLQVITAKMFLRDPAIPEDRRLDLQSKWDLLQGQLLKLSSCASQTVVPTSGHFVQRDAPDAVVRAVLTQVEAARTELAYAAS